MIISHKHKFIFIKTRKTSGTSMEISLSQFCGYDDIITPITYEDELVRQDLGGRLPQNYGDPREEQYRDHIRARKTNPRRVRHMGRYYNHIPAVEVRKHIGDDIWNEYFKFSIERHPYDTVVSHIHFHARKKNHWNFETELKRTLKKGYFVSHPVYSEGEKPIIDFVLNYEQLHRDLETLSDKLGFDVAAHYPRTKHKHRSDRRPARELLSPVARQEIYERCHVAFDSMGFER